MLNVDTYTRKLSTIADSAGFNQIVANPTRCTDTSQTLIDLIFTNIHRLQEDARNMPSFTDHEIISTSIPAKIENRPDIILKRNLTAQNIYKINIKLVQCDWKYSCEDIEALYTNFINNINKCVDDIAPLVEHHNHTKQWIDGEVKAAQKERDIHYKTFRYTNKKEDYVKYKQSRNKVVSLLRKKEKQHYEDKIDRCRNDSKKMWKTLKELDPINGFFDPSNASSSSTSTLPPSSSSLPSMVAALGLLAAITAGLLLHLCFFHIYISFLGLTTYEYIRQQRQQPIASQASKDEEGSGERGGANAMGGTELRHRPVNLRCGEVRDLRCLPINRESHVIAKRLEFSIYL
nr:unnamed protein product [Callosobruchus analis]